MITVKINNNDVSSFVNECEHVPIVLRNRSYEPVLREVNITINRNCIHTISENHIVEILNGTTPYFLGYVFEINDDRSSTTYTVVVYNYLYKLNEYTIKNSSFLAQVRLVTDYSSALTFAPSDVNTVTNEITIADHGFDNDDVIMFTSAGTLPDPVQANYQYYVRRIDLNTFAIKINAFDDLVLIDQGTGTHSVTDDVELNDFIRRDNEAYSNTNIKWLFQKMFGLAGIGLVTSSVDSSQIHTTVISAVSYNWVWSEMVLDYQMFQHIGFPSATNDPAKVDQENELTFWEFISKICSYFAFTIRYTGTTTNKQFTLYKGGTVSNYTVNNDKAFDYKSRIIKGLNDSVYGIEQFAARSAYYAGSETALTEEGEMTAANRKTSLNYPTNLKILLRKKSGTPADGDIETDDYYTINDAGNQFRIAYEVDWQEVSFMTEILSEIKALVKEISIDPASNLFYIVQEDTA